MVLRPWGADDAAALARAWVDPEIVAGARRGDEPDEAAAASWIAGAGSRQRAGRSLDWAVIEPGSPAPGAVRGEVGVWPLSPQRAVIEVGWWTRAEDRGRGLATVAVSVVLAWARPTLRPEAVVARIAPAHEPSEHVARAAGLEPVGTLGDGRRLWRTPPG